MISEEKICTSVVIKLPWSRQNDVPVNIHSWLLNNVGSSGPDTWALASIKGSLNSWEDYSFIFNDPNKAMLFKLVWG